MRRATTRVAFPSSLPHRGTSETPAFVAGLAVRVFVAGCVAAAVSACGGGLAVEVVVGQPPVVALEIQLTETAPDQIRVDWSNDPDVYQYVVARNGTDFASVMATTLFDTSVLVNAQYCYQVSGYDRVGNLIARSNTACIVVAS